MLNDVKARIATKKAELDHLRPLRPGALESLQHYYDVELTYTSNAIEGNTLTYRETAELIEHGITVGGKSIRDHLEIEDHYQAIQIMRKIAAADTVIDEVTVVELHRRILLRNSREGELRRHRPAPPPDLPHYGTLWEVGWGSGPVPPSPEQSSGTNIAGVYSRFPRRIAGSSVIFPNPAKIPALMARFGEELSGMPATPDTAFERHFRLVAIHPFSDGNGRTARLLMNLLLLRGGYPPVAVRPEDRTEYLAAIEQATLAEDLAVFQAFMHQRLDATLAEYVALCQEALPAHDPE